MPGTLRTFVGLSLPDGHRQALALHLAECARLAPAYRWVEPDALHLTLRFLGHVEPGVLDAVRDGLAGIRAAPFRLALAERGTFGPRRSPRVVWLGLAEGLDACAALAAAVERACQAAGLEAEPRGFRAHVTLARARAEGDRLGELPEPPRLAPWTVEDFVLFESRLRQQPRYVPLERYGLGDAR
ncbi:MAG TPA: RNA 2',3'-cyclic phosphodiesterase [Candidatus Dormibacteraeota bacterium]|nr:RNA 2',3'-cyclic phosphodiesterase [Candidatus Dormibacteraeota bacterium]